MSPYRGLIFGSLGAVVLGAAGFAWGARVPDERAGEVAMLAGAIGAGVGLLLGVALSVIL